MCDDGCMLGGGRSIQLGRILGIRIGASPSWFFVLFLLIFSLSPQYNSEFPGNDSKAFLLAALTAAGFLLSILLHELGHAFTARARGVQVRGVELWFFGGFTYMEREPSDPRTDLLIAAAGPLVTLVIAALAFLAGAASSSTSRFFDAVAHGQGGIGAGAAVLSYLAFINAVLLVFNLVPGLPLDGGRIARALIWWRTGDQGRATIAAAQLGRGISYVLFALAAVAFVTRYYYPGVYLALIAFIVFSASRAIIATAAATRPPSGLRVEDVMDSQPVTILAETPLDRGFEDYFLRFGWDWFPAVDADGRFLGLVTRERIEAVPEAQRPAWTVGALAQAETRDTFRIGVDAPLESLLASRALGQLGALMAVDAGGVLRGVVTVEQVRRALRPSPV